MPDLQPTMVSGTGRNSKPCSGRDYRVLDLRTLPLLMDDYGHQIWNWAIKGRPGQLVTAITTDKDNNVIDGSALYDPDLQLLHTNIPGCPLQKEHDKWHHTGVRCVVCGWEE